jgi:hypothetical protein
VKTAILREVSLVPQRHATKGKGRQRNGIYCRREDGKKQKGQEGIHERKKWRMHIVGVETKLHTFYR